MRYFSVLMLIILVFMLPILAGCGNGLPAPGSTSTVTAAFAALRLDGFTPASASSLAHPNGGGAGRRALKLAHSSGQRLAAAVVPSGEINIYGWSEAALGKDWKLTAQPGNYYSVALSADGSKAVSNAKVGNYLQIFLSAVDTAGHATTETQLTTDSIDHYGPKLSPDGSQVVFTTQLAGSHDQLCILTLAGSALNCLAIAGFDPANLWQPSWTPDGKIVFEAWDCYTACPPGQVADNIFMVKTDGSGFTQVTAYAGEGSYAEGPSVSSDGTRMAVTHYGADPTTYADIYLIDLNTKAETQITHGDITHVHSYDPLFVGNQIVYVSKQATDHYSRLYAMNIDGSNSTPVSPDTAQSYFDDDEW